jgi:hypothetical protein
MGGVGGSGMGGGGGPGAGGGPGSLLDPQCWDGQVYAAEPVPKRTDISDLVASFNVANRKPWVVSVLERRYALGALNVQQALTGRIRPGTSSASMSRSAHPTRRQ